MVYFDALPTSGLIHNQDSIVNGVCLSLIGSLIHNGFISNSDALNIFGFLQTLGSIAIVGLLHVVAPIYRVG